MNHGPHDICRSCETVDHCSSAGCIPLTTPSGAKVCSMNPDSLPSEMVLVPREPTEAMMQAATTAWRHAQGTLASYMADRCAYRAMLAAAPQGAQPVQPVAWLNPNGQLRHRKYLETDRPLVYASPADAAPVMPQEVRMPLYGLVPPSAHEWLSNSSPPAAASTDWLSGWDACRNRVRTLVDAAMNAGLTIPEKEQPKC